MKFYNTAGEEITAIDLDGGTKLDELTPSRLGGFKFDAYACEAGYVVMVSVDRSDEAAGILFPTLPALVAWYAGTVAPINTIFRR